MRNVEQLSTSAQQVTLGEPSTIDELLEEHRAYLLERHGTLDLDPIPGFRDADPYNWSSTNVSYLSGLHAGANIFLEGCQSGACRISRHDGHFHSVLQSIRVWQHC